LSLSAHAFSQTLPHLINQQPRPITLSQSLTTPHATRLNFYTQVISHFAKRLWNYATLNSAYIRLFVDYCQSPAIISIRHPSSFPLKTEV